MSAFPNVIRMLAAITMNYILCDNKKCGANCRKYNNKDIPKIEACKIRFCNLI